MRAATLLACLVVAGCVRTGGLPATPAGSTDLGVPQVSLERPTAAGYDELYSFSGHASGGEPTASLFDYKGTLYGTAPQDGKGFGTVFAVTRYGKLRVLHEFRGFPDGAYPQAALAALDGELYGTTSAGGAQSAGTVFAITPSGVEHVVHSFGKLHDGAAPEASLLVHDGVLYGTTQNGGAHDRGIVFSLTESGKEEILHDFAGAPKDGGHPTAGLVFVDGDFYGVTRAGGKSASGGAVFKMSPLGRESVMHSFGIKPDDGKNPAGTPIFHNGVFFGTTLHGGQYGNGGTVFEMTPRGAELVLHSFGRGTDGAFPAAGLVAVKNELFGTTLGGGDSPRRPRDCISSGVDRVPGYYRCGTIFKINQFGQERLVYHFQGYPDGANPQDALTDVDGVLYGTTTWGGSATYYGTIFRLLP
jgi:uncharacterized repeat protein (TIGR03803 family)